MERPCLGSWVMLGCGLYRDTNSPIKRNCDASGIPNHIRSKIAKLSVTKRQSTGKRPIQGDAAHLEQFGHVLAALAVLDELAGVFNLLPG
jgi:hypothetical protein